mmetsp:Transcript_21811/g.72202  ORF Transcript_21811/g.72202 Transcript_21811/m.72202 type:complete len:212 (-) Transcript_21811:281-916(-)
MAIAAGFVVASGDWQSIIHIGSSDSIRQPSLFFAPGGQLHVTLYDGGVQWGTYYAPATTDGAIFQAGQTYDVVVDCAYDASTGRYTQSTIIDGVTTDTTTSATRNLVAGEQPVYVGSPFRAFRADVVLTDVKFEPTPYTPLPCPACPACGGSSNSGGSGAASLAIVIPVVIAAVLLVAAILFLVYKRVVAARQHRRESMPTIAADEAEAEA